ncbi:MAG: hypothetical protein JSU68_01120 [Phycisphaerales bacterium]|nr:MAG: hypothetical protein JSU68_01120 [Phycisphaerales bacterium]
MKIHSMWKNPLLLVPAFTMCIATGCGRSFTALPADGQVPVGDDQGILEKRTGVAVLVRVQSIPWDHGSRFTAFNVEITNSRAESLAIGPGRLALVDEEGIARRAVDPAVLEQAFESAVSDAAEGVPAHLRHAVVSGYRHRPRCGRASYYRYRSYHRPYYCEPYYGTYWYFGWGPYYYYDYYDGLYEQQLSRERIAQFLTELLRQRELEPNEATGGHVLFGYYPQKDEEVTIRLEVDPPGREQGAHAPEPTQFVRFEFRFSCRH